MRTFKVYAQHDGQPSKAYQVDCYTHNEAIQATYEGLCSPPLTRFMAIEIVKPEPPVNILGSFK
jgi:hypothetical protein